MRVAACIKRVPITGGRILLTEDSRGINTQHLGFTMSPHEECGVEEAVRVTNDATTVVSFSSREGDAPRAYQSALLAVTFALAVPTLILAHQVLIVTVPQLIHALLPASVRALLQIL